MLVDFYDNITKNLGILLGISLKLMLAEQKLELAIETGNVPFSWLP